jgi:hypothetical protein
LAKIGLLAQIIACHGASYQAIFTLCLHFFRVSHTYDSFFLVRLANWLYMADFLIKKAFFCDRLANFRFFIYERGMLADS